MSEPYYSDEYVTLFLGDCREVTEWLEADVLVTDPPYGVRWTSGVSRYVGTGRLNAKTTPISGDDSTTLRDEALAAWGGRPAIVFGSWRAPRPGKVLHRLIWHKKGQNPGPINAAFMSQDEEVYVLGVGDWRKSSPPLRSVITTTENRPIEVAKIGHPTPKPVGLMEVLIDRCPPGIIADPFAGSGSTLIAAKQLGRHAIGVELDESYCEIAAKRLCQDVLDFGEVGAR